MSILQWIAEQTGLSEDSDPESGLAKGSGVAHSIPFIDRIAAAGDALNRRGEDDTGARPIDVIREVITGASAGSPRQVWRAATELYPEAVSNYAGNALEMLGGGEGFDEYAEAYDRALDRRQAATNRTMEERPGEFLAGAAAGSLPQMLIPGVGQTNLAKNAGTLGRVGLMAAEGAAYGGLHAAGNSQGETARDVLADGASGAVTGGALSGGLGALGVGAQRAVSGLRTRAARNTLRHANIDPARIADFTDDQLQDAARMLRERGVGVSRSSASAGQQAAGMKDEAGEAIGAILDEMEDAYQASRTPRLAGALPPETARTASSSRQIVEQFANPGDVTMLADDAGAALSRTAPRGRRAVATADTLLDARAPSPASSGPVSPPPLPRMAEPPRPAGQGLYRQAAWPAVRMEAEIGPRGGEVLRRITSRVDEAVPGLDSSSRGARRGTQRLVEDYIAQRGDDAGNLSPREIFNMRRNMDQLAGNWARQGRGFRQQAMREARNEAQGILDEIAEQALQGEGQNQYQQARRMFRLGALAEDGTERALNRAGNNRMISPTDYLAAGAGMAGTGNPAMAAAGAAGNRLLRGRERALASLAQRGAAGAGEGIEALSRTSTPRTAGAGAAALLGMPEPSVRSESSGSFELDDDSFWDAGLDTGNGSVDDDDFWNAGLE